MARKQNCWEFKKCGREFLGAKVDELGICPAATENRLNGAHGGVDAGRACWVVVETFCDDKVQGTFSRKSTTCQDCDFYKLVVDEEFPYFEYPPSLLAKLK